MPTTPNFVRPENFINRTRRRVNDMARGVGVGGNYDENNNGKISSERVGGGGVHAPLPVCTHYRGDGKKINRLIGNK